MRYILIAVFTVFIMSTSASALRTVDLVEGATEFADISKKELNVIIFPFPVKVLSKSESLEIKIEGKRIFISVIGDMKESLQPSQLYFLTNNETYSMVLTPRDIPGETIIGNSVESKNKREESTKWETEHPYIVTVKEMIKAMYNEITPSGFEVKDVKNSRDIARWQGLKQNIFRVYTGSNIIGEIHNVRNVSNAAVHIKEKDFYGTGMLAVSLDKHELAPDEVTNLYIVKSIDQDNSQGVINALSHK